MHHPCIAVCCAQVGEMVEEDQADADGIGVGQAGAAAAGGAAGEADGGAAGRSEEAEEKAAAAAAAAEEEEEEEEEVLEEPDEETLGKMSSMEQRLFKIRLKMNKVS